VRIFKGLLPSLSLRLQHSASSLLAPLFFVSTSTQSKFSIGAPFLRFDFNIHSTQQQDMSSARMSNIVVTATDGNYQLHVPTPTCPRFIENLYAMLEDSTSFSIISWSRAGNSIQIKNVADLETKVLPQFFKHSNLQSFVRQLNMYGFVKIGRDASVREYQNENFIRGRPELLLVIRRKSHPAAAHNDIEDQQSSPTSSFSSKAAAGAAANAVVIAEAPVPWPRKAASDSAEDLRWRVRELERMYQDLAAKHEKLQDMLISAINGGGPFLSTLSNADDDALSVAPSSAANKTGRSLLDLVDAAIVSSERESGEGDDPLRKRIKVD